MFWNILLVTSLFLGTVGNTLSVIVMRSKELRGSNASMIITFVSITDTIYLLFRNFGMIYKTTGYYKKVSNCLIDNFLSIVLEVSFRLKLKPFICSLFKMNDNLSRSRYI